jgi:mono/diheme cytochrome c family protein
LQRIEDDEEELMRFLRDALITVVVLVAVVMVVAYARLRAGGLSADVEPGPLERTVAARLVRLSISPEDQRRANPFRDDGETWRAAVDHYADHCAVCHGADGAGRTEVGENMYPKVPDLTSNAVQGLSDGALFAIIQNGVRWTGMPAWKSEHSEEETWRLVSLVRHVPTMTPEERDQLHAAAKPEDEHHHEH